MSENALQVGSLVLYKDRPALVRRVDKKVQIEMEDGELRSVRIKDVALLHPGPLESLDLAEPPAGEMEAAWELLAGTTTNLAELAELAFGEFTPATAWATWREVMDGLRFSGTPEAIEVHTAAEVAQTEAARQAKAAEERAWQEFLERVQQGRYLPEDRRYLREVEDLALGRRDRCRVLRELRRTQTPQQAHALLLKLGYWDYTVNPYPQRLNVITEPAAASLPALPAEERRDLSHLPAFAIDDEGNQDPDDAVSFDGQRLWVHVADVAALVTPESPADLEARARGANLYLPEGTVTMLPWEATERLGLGLADRSPALSFAIELGNQGGIREVEVMPSWVRVIRLTYEEAEARLEEEPLASLLRLAQMRRGYRQARGAVFIDLPEVKIRVVDGQVVIRPLLPLCARDLVAEAMLAAGEAVARFALAHNIPLPFTTQEPPDPPSGELPPGLAGMFALRRMLKPSQESSIPRPHSGLGLEVYARATSPLRRYLDLVVHQQLRAFLRGDAPLDAQAVLERVGAAEAVLGNLRQAERLARQHWTLVYLQQQGQWSGEGVLVERMGPRGTVLIPKLGWEARLNLPAELPLNGRVQLALKGISLPQLVAHFRLEDWQAPGKDELRAVSG